MCKLLTQRISDAGRNGLHCESSKVFLERMFLKKHSSKTSEKGLMIGCITVWPPRPSGLRRWILDLASRVQFPSLLSWLVFPGAQS